MNDPKLKRKYGDRADWKRVIHKEFTQEFFEEEGFHGYVTLIKVHKVTEPLYFHYGNKEICIVNDGYTWMQHFPAGSQHSLTTMFNAGGEVVQWYIDICLQNGIENGRPYMDDLFLDVIILPGGEVLYKDYDELLAAFSSGIINENLYKTAIIEAKKIKRLAEANEFKLLQIARIHKEYFDWKMQGNGNEED
ncbi:DUF402 domain-containing protein [Mesobacillus jeotgali]|uniref:DUF402 domain-containing protein n=1 Tax=Mesobacillus jeotgali TaxID=129985 RepID=UPI0009A6F7A9|nr:DUF402 domain-containing protein [Mesobacillus jeotgali]